MKYFLIGTTLLVSILLIVVVVAQESKQPGMGSAIGGGAEAVAGGKTRGKDAVLSKLLWYLALSLRCSASYLGDI